MYYLEYNTVVVVRSRSLLRPEKKLQSSVWRVVLLCQFLVLAGNAEHYFPADCFEIEQEIVFGVAYVLSVQYSCAVVSVFLLWLFGVTYVLSVQYSCAVVSVFLLWRES